jgi:Zn-dependent protease
VDQLSPEFLMFGLIWYGVFLFSTTCHEASHALVAKLGGDPTAFHGGQVTLNPAPHISREPFGMVLVPILSYVLGGGMIGWASAPYDPLWQQRYPRRAAWMSLAGPGANFTLAILAAIGIHIGIAAGIFQAPAIATFQRVVEVVDPETAGEFSTFAATVLSILFFLNVLLGTFNLLPMPPLDGGTGVTILMGERTALRFLEFIQQPGFQMVGMIAAWVLFDKLFGPIFRLALNLLYPGAGYGS